MNYDAKLTKFQKARWLFVDGTTEDLTMLQLLKDIYVTKYVEGFAVSASLRVKSESLFLQTMEHQGRCSRLFAP